MGDQLGEPMITLPNRTAMPVKESTKLPLQIASSAWLLTSACWGWLGCECAIGQYFCSVWKASSLRPAKPDRFGIHQVPTVRTDFLN